jgi:hypothetical protein
MKYYKILNVEVKNEEGKLVAKVIATYSIRRGD